MVEIREAPAFDPARLDLERVVAWLVVNALKSEQLQWSMLCAQNLKNVYRKAAFKALLDEETPAGGALDVFEEAIDVSLEASVPDPAPFAAKLKMLVDRHAAFCASESDRATAARVLADVAAHAVERKSRGGKRLDTEQEREQEQEQEKEIRAARDQRVEVEKFVEREYSRDAETASPWPLSALAAFEPAADDDDAPFFPLAELALRAAARAPRPPPAAPAAPPSAPAAPPAALRPPPPPRPRTPRPARPAASAQRPASGSDPWCASTGPPRDQGRGGPAPRATGRGGR